MYVFTSLFKAAIFQDQLAVLWSREDYLSILDNDLEKALFL